MGNKDEWLLIMFIVTWMLILGATAWGDVTDAPIDNVVRLSTPAGNGSGFLLGDGRMITAKHVAVMCEMAMIAHYNDGTIEIITQPQIRMSDTMDIAVITVKRKGKLLTVFDGDLTIGYPIYTMSMPYSYNVRYASTGVIGSGRFDFDIQQWTWVNLLLTDITAVPGMSGGPVFNNNDEVVGIVVAVMGKIVLIEDNKSILEFLNDNKKQDKSKEAKALP